MSKPEPQEPSTPESKKRSFDDSDLIPYDELVSRATQKPGKNDYIPMEWDIHYVERMEKIMEAPENAIEKACLDRIMESDRVKNALKGLPPAVKQSKYNMIRNLNRSNMRMSVLAKENMELDGVENDSDLSEEDKRKLMGEIYQKTNQMYGIEMDSSKCRVAIEVIDHEDDE